MKIYVGDDIVDLTAVATDGSKLQARFIDRVMAASEQQYLAQVLHPQRELWKLWSAKEAAFKIVKKILPEAIFEHRQFIVNVLSDLHGQVTYHTYQISVSWAHAHQWIYCQGVYCPDICGQGIIIHRLGQIDDVTELKLDFSPAELSSIYSQESKGVRTLAKLLLKEFWPDMVEIIRRPLAQKFAPPEIWSQGECKSSWDISMSHDGKYLSCVIAFVA